MTHDAEQRHVVFVTTELAPYGPGGAGAVVADLSDLLSAHGRKVTVVLVGEAPTPVPGHVIVVDSSPDPAQRSRAAAEALGNVAAAHRIDLVEFLDFDGLAFWTLAMRTELDLEHVPIQIRFHGTTDMMFERIGTEPPEIALARELERSSIMMCDRLVVPGHGIESLVLDRYEIPSARVIVAPPPLPSLPRAPLQPTDRPVILSVGRLNEVKGTHDLIVAMVPVLRNYPTAELHLVGEDGWSATAQRPMRIWLEDELIPADVASRVVFAGRREGNHLVQEMQRAWVTVVASRFESFNLASRQAREMGLPVIVPDIPAFADVGEAEGFLKFDGSVDGLGAAVTSIITDSGMRGRLAAAPVPAPGNGLAPYANPPVPHHPREQGGLGTIAVQRLDRLQPPLTDETWTPDDDHRSLLRRIGARTLLTLPDGMARVVVSWVPRRVRDKLAFIVDWRFYSERRHIDTERRARERQAEELRSDLDRRVRSGSFPELDDPAVTVVIPCHDDGHFLDEAIRSVFGQTETSWEIIIVDDGSTEPSTLDVLAGLDWPRTTVISQPNRGLSAARNAGMQAARGRFLVPLDADDRLAPRFIERLTACLSTHEDAAFASCWARLFGDINAIWVPRPYNSYQMLLSNSIIGCVVMRSDAWKAVGGYDETLRHGNEDWDLWLRFMESGWRCVEVPEPLFEYRKHGISMSVETEARFERGRAEIVERHPTLYEYDRLIATKRENNPLVTVIAEEAADVRSLASQTVHDLEVISLGRPSKRLEALCDDRSWRLGIADDLGLAVDAAHGKYVTTWSTENAVRPDVLHRLVATLESTPTAGVASTTSTPPLSVTRTWSARDPIAPATQVVIDVQGTGGPTIEPGAHPLARWSPPPEIEGLPVRRQKPEEEGPVPKWVKR